MQHPDGAYMYWACGNRGGIHFGMPQGPCTWSPDGGLPAGLEIFIDVCWHGACCFHRRPVDVGLDQSDRGGGSLSVPWGESTGSRAHHKASALPLREAHGNPHVASQVTLSLLGVLAFSGLTACSHQADKPDACSLVHLFMKSKLCMLT